MGSRGCDYLGVKILLILIGLALVGAACGDSTPASPSTQPSTSTTTDAVEPTPVTETTSEPEASAAAAPNVVEVAFPSAEMELVGSLRLPGGGPSPAVVLIHGSGPNSRDAVLPGQLNMTFGFEIPVFAEIADALQGAGFAVLTYDKRTCGPFNGCADNGYPLPSDDIVIDGFIADAAAAVAFLKQHPAVDPTRISVIGHSQGAEFIPVLLADDPSLFSGVMLSGPYRPIDQIVEYQFDSTLTLLGLLGLTPEQALGAPGVVQLSETVDGLKAIRNGGEEAVGGASAAFWQSWFDLETARIEAVSELTQPVLILGGRYDWNVPHEEAVAWDEQFLQAGAEHETVVLDCVTHVLNCVTQADITMVAPDDIGRHVADSVIAELVGFLTE